MRFLSAVLAILGLPFFLGGVIGVLAGADDAFLMAFGCAVVGGLMCLPALYLSYKDDPDPVRIDLKTPTGPPYT